MRVYIAYGGVIPAYVVVVEQHGLRWTKVRTQLFKALKELTPDLRAKAF